MAASLPLTIGGVDFLPNTVGSPATLGQNAINIPAGSAITAVIASLDLIEGVLVSGISVEVVDNVGTTLNAVWGDSTGAILGTSPTSAGTGAVQTLPIVVVPQALAANTAYWIAVNLIGGALGWTVSKARIS